MNGVLINLSPFELWIFKVMLYAFFLGGCIKVMTIFAAFFSWLGGKR